MRIVIDMQGAQSESRFRGIGRYTTALTQALKRNAGEHGIVLALSGLYPDTIDPIRTEFAGFVPPSHIRVWKAAGPVLGAIASNAARRKAAELMREAFLSSLRPDLIHISTLFEGYGNEVVVSIGTYDTTTPISVTLYDLIPLLNPEHYLEPHPEFDRQYRRTVEQMSNASCLLAISDSARREGLSVLDVPESAVTNISAAADDEFRVLEIDDATQGALFEKFDLKDGYILYTGGFDERKNVRRLIEAFARIPEHQRKGRQLLFVGKINRIGMLDYRLYAHSVGLDPGTLRFTGYASDEELVQLYNLCGLFVFPSWHEGFGLPPLEAMRCGAAVIGANATSIPEVIGLDDAMFDPFDVDDMARCIERGLNDPEYRKRLLDNNARQVAKFSWDRSARLALHKWQEVLSQTDHAATVPVDLPRVTNNLISRIAALTSQGFRFSDEDLCAIAAAIDHNEREAADFLARSGRSNGAT